jgi:transposase
METLLMMVFGVDPHKQTHTAVAADELGRKKAAKTVRARRDGHRELIAWARETAPGGRLWAVEDVRHVAGGLIRELLAAGEQVVFVPPKLMAGARKGGRERGKSDPIDALAIARAALREDADLPAARLDEQVRPVRLLSDHRDDLVAERTRVINRLRWMVHDLAPDLAPKPGALTSARRRAGLAAGLAALPDTAGRRIALSQLARITALTTEITGLEHDLAALVAALVPELLQVTGVSTITAARILGETGDIRRFKSQAAYARHNGTAPIPVWSANSGVHRLNPAGNRQLNAAIHRIAVTQARCHDGARALMQRRSENTQETRKASRRVLKRHISDVVYRALAAGAWRLDQPHQQTA